MSDELYGTITEEGLEELRDRIGVTIDEPDPYVHEATLDTIRHWSHGIGCTDPLYTDEQYAESGPYGDLIAPPTFLFATSRVMSGYVGGLPGVHAMYSGADWEWYRPIERGDRIYSESRLSDLVEKDTDFSGRSIQQIYTVDFYNRDDEHVATADSWCFRTERDTASEDKKKYESEGVELADWDESDIERFAEHYRNQEPRGDDPRYFEDVEVGDELDTLLKGPMSITSVIAFDQGWGGLYIRAHEQLFEMLDAHPALGTPNQFGVPEPPERVHWDHEFAQQVGVPAAYDYGPERVSWLGHVATHWMGDHGVLRNLYAEVRRHNLLGDVTWCSGDVTDKRIEDGDHLVELDLYGRDQRDNVTVKGSATVQLPTRADGPESALATYRE